MRNWTCIHYGNYTSKWAHWTKNWANTQFTPLIQSHTCEPNVWDRNNCSQFKFSGKWRKMRQLDYTNQFMLESTSSVTSSRNPYARGVISAPVHELYCSDVRVTSACRHNARDVVYARVRQLYYSVLSSLSNYHNVCMFNSAAYWGKIAPYCTCAVNG